MPLQPVVCARTQIGEERPLAPFAGLVTVMPEPLGGGEGGGVEEPDDPLLLLLPPATLKVVLTVGQMPLLTQDL